MRDESPQRYPLDWPPSEPRTPAEKRDWGPYKVSQARAVDDLLAELRLLGARNVVLSTDQRLRRDGLPYAAARVDDPGAALYWTRRGRDYCIACDRYSKLASNVRAIGLAVHHLRRLEQAAPAFAERAFSGFARLPASIATPPPRTWWDVLERPERTREAIEAAYRRLARERHPDAGGSHEDMAELNRARTEALEAVARG